MLKPHTLLALLLTFAAMLHAQQLPDLQQATPLGQQLFLDSASTGMVLGVVRNHEVYLHGFGETAPGSRITPSATSFLRLCSLSKIFATDLLTQLSSQRVVRLEDPLQLYAPPHIRVPSRPNHLITLEDLATHTASLPREVGPTPRDTPHFTFPDYAYRWHWLPTQTLRKNPGTAALYSNIGFDLLGDALSHAARQPYARLFSDRITRPLGMLQTTFTPTAAQCSRLLLGTHNEGPCTDTQSSAASAGVYSTATDMALFLKYLLGNSSPAQDPAAQAIYLDPATLTSVSGLEHAGKPTGIGLGWMHTSGSPVSTETASTGNIDLIEKTGGGAGFLTYIVLNHSANTALFLAVTDGHPRPGAKPHLNLFRAANNLLLALDGLPPLPIPPPRAPTKSKRRTRPTAHKPAAHGPQKRAAR